MAGSGGSAGAALVSGGRSDMPPGCEFFSESTIRFQAVVRFCGSLWLVRHSSLANLVHCHKQHRRIGWPEEDCLFVFVLRRKQEETVCR